MEGQEGGGLGDGRAIGGAAQAQPTFQPVREKIFPAELILIGAFAKMVNEVSTTWSIANGYLRGEPS